MSGFGGSSGLPGPPGPPGPSGSGAAWSHVAIVNPVNGDDSTASFGGTSFKTIQAACNAVPAGVDSATIRSTWLILISPETYDENLVIDGTRRKIALLGLGPWNLGTFNSPSWQPNGVARNIIWNVTAGNIDSVRSSLAIGNMLGYGEDFSTHLSYNTSPRISGRIIINDTVLGGTTKELYIQAQVHDLAAVGKSVDYASGNGILNLYLWRSRCLTDITGVNKARLQAASYSRFDGLVDVNNFSRIDYCHMTAGMTVAADVADVQPSGITNTNFSGTFTGPANSLRLDANSNYWFKTNGASLAGGASKVIQTDLVP